MVRKTIPQRSDHFGVAEDNGPSAEAEIGRDDHIALRLGSALKSLKKDSYSICKGNCAALWKSWLGDLDSNQGCPGQSREFYR